jgi:hypothetical protein
VATASFEARAENGEARRAVFMDGTAPHKPGAILAKVHAKGGEVIGKAAAHGGESILGNSRLPSRV